MTRKDFQMIADVVKMIDNKDTRHTVAMNFAVKLKGVNPRFSVSKFATACNSYATVEAAGDEVRF